jgi:DNA-binding MarR family transcriptional regulator
MQTGSAGGGLGYTLGAASQAWRTEVGAALKDFALTVPQFLVLMAMYRPARHGWRPPTQAEVGAQLGMDANTASQIVRALVARRLVDRLPHPEDRRARLLSLTESGLALAKDSSAVARATNDVFFSAVSPEQRRLLTTILESITTASENRS